MDKIDAAVDLLRRHNLWRRGDENVEMVDVALLGTAIDIACEELPRLRARLSHQQGWIDAVMKRGVVGYWHQDLPGGFTQHDLIGAQQLIIRPKPLAKAGGSGRLRF